MGKLMFQWVYWHVLLPGREIPGISDQMQMAGKHRARRARGEHTVTTQTIAGQAVEVDAEGFLVDPEQWTRGDRRGDRARERHRPS